MNKCILSLAAVFALIAAPSSLEAAETVLGYKGNVVFRGRGLLRTAGFGTVRIKGRTEIVIHGSGQLTLPAGAKYRPLRSTSWTTAEGSPLQGTAGMRIRLDQHETAVLRGVGALRVHTRMGGVGTVSLTGKGKVAVGSRRVWDVLEGAQNETSPESVPGDL